MENSELYSIKDFQILGKVGQGSFGSVYKAKNKQNNETVAIKEIKVSASDRKNIESIAQEMRILCSIDHKNIVSYKCSFWNTRKTSVYIVMEFLGGGDLQERVNKCKRRRTYIPESKIWSYLIQMLSGLKVLHDLKIIHRDIKSANTFLSEDLETCKLGDMNVSKIARNHMARTQVGTPLYISPEIWQGRTYDFKTDIWSLGCLLYEMCSLNYPFLGMNMNDLKRSVLRGRYAPIPHFYDKDLTTIIDLMLQLNPASRPTVVQLLNHPIILKRVKLNHEMTVRDLKQLDMKLMETILIPYDFRKMKLPAKPKKLGVKRSNSVADIRPSAINDRPDSARGPVHEQDKVSKWDLQKLKRQSKPYDSPHQALDGGPDSAREISRVEQDEPPKFAIPNPAPVEPTPQQENGQNGPVQVQPQLAPANFQAKNPPVNPSRLPSKVPPKPIPNKRPVEPVQPAQQVFQRRPSLGRAPPSRADSRGSNRGIERSDSRGSARGSARGSVDKIRIYGAKDNSSKENLNNYNNMRPSSRGSNQPIVIDGSKKAAEVGRPKLQRAPSADGRMRYDNYDSRPRWWG